MDFSQLNNGAILKTYRHLRRHPYSKAERSFAEKPGLFIDPSIPVRRYLALISHLPKWASQDLIDESRKLRQAAGLGPYLRVADGLFSRLRVHLERVGLSYFFPKPGHQRKRLLVSLVEVKALAYPLSYSEEQAVLTLKEAEQSLSMTLTQSRRSWLQLAVSLSMAIKENKSLLPEGVKLVIGGEYFEDERGQLAVPVLSRQGRAQRLDLLPLEHLAGSEGKFFSLRVTRTRRYVDVAT